MQTTQRAAIAADNLLGRRVVFHLQPHSNATALTCDWLGDLLYKHLMGLLASAGFDGRIDWTYEVDSSCTCIAIDEYSHADSAVHILQTIACDPVLSSTSAPDWTYSYWTRYLRMDSNITPAQHILSTAYLRTKHYYWRTPGGTENTEAGWQLVLPFADTSDLVRKRHRVPNNVLGWENGTCVRLTTNAVGGEQS